MGISGFYRLVLIIFPTRTQKPPLDIILDAVDGFELHPLKEASTLPALTNNKVEEGFPGSGVLAFKFF
jgi:hypothetical protein